MKAFLEILVILAALVFVLAWVQSRGDRLTGWNPGRDTDTGPPEPPAGITENDPHLRQNQPDHGDLGTKPELYRKPFVCLAQHPDGWICGRVKDHVGAHYPTFGDTKKAGFPMDYTWPRVATNESVPGPHPVSHPVGAKTSLHVAPGSPSATPPPTTVSPENADIPQRRKTRSPVGAVSSGSWAWAQRGRHSRGFCRRWRPRPWPEYRSLPRSTCSGGRSLLCVVPCTCTETMARSRVTNGPAHAGDHRAIIGEPYSQAVESSTDRGSFGRGSGPVYNFFSWPGRRT